MTEKPKRKVWKRWWFWALIVVALWIAFVKNIYIMSGSSMSPTLKDQEVVFMQRWLFTLRRGDMAVFRYKDGKSEGVFLKRVIGLPGDKIEIQDGRVLVNGAALDEPYAKQPTNPTTSVTLGGDQYFVLGDNRTQSYDSRAFGPILRGDIVGKAVGR